MEEMVTITLKEYQWLRFNDAIWDAYCDAGVDNWEGCEFVERPQEEDYLGPNGVRPS